MKPPLIDSRTNSLVRLFRSAREGEDESALFIEGPKMLEEALVSGVAVRRVGCVASEESATRKILEKYKKVHVPLVLLSEGILDFISDTETPQGCVALAERSKAEAGIPTDGWAQSLIVVACGIQHPQNVGNLLRTSEAAGVEEVWTLKGTADPFSPKVLRGSSGSAFRLPIRTKLLWEDTITFLKEKKIQCLTAVADGKERYDRVDWKKPTALFLGSEGSGFTAQQLEDLPQTIKIPMAGKVESLNVGTAAAVCLFEAVRQRGGKS